MGEKGRTADSSDHRMDPVSGINGYRAFPSDLEHGGRRYRGKSGAGLSNPYKHDRYHKIIDGSRFCVFVGDFCIGEKTAGLVSLRLFDFNAGFFRIFHHKTAAGKMNFNLPKKTICILSNVLSRSKKGFFHDL